MVHHLLRCAEPRHDDEALVDGSRRLTYAQLDESVQRLAAGLRRLGLRRGSRVAIYLEPGLEQVLAMLATSRAGGVFVPIHPQLLAHQVQHVANDCGAELLVTACSKLEALEPLGNLSSVRHIVGVGDVDQGEKYGVVPFDALPEDEPLDDFGTDRDLAAILYTSGSTGKPKGVMLSHANIVAGATLVSAYLDITRSDRLLGLLPLTFDAGLNQLTTALQQGGALVMISRQKAAFPNAIVRMLHEERITGLGAVPTIWANLAARSTLSRNPPPRLRYITNTGGPLPLTVLGALREALPDTKIFLMYGLTEAFRSTYLPPGQLDSRPTSIGKAIPNTEILVLDGAGRPCGPGETGELVHRGPTVAMGYWGRPEDSARVFRPNPLAPPELGDHERVVYSGDLVQRDEDGFLYFVGRRDAMIKSSGFRISPAEVEEALYGSGTVESAGVIGVRDDVLGQAIWAYVVARGQPRDDLAEALIEHCRGVLPAHMVPKRVVVIADIPKTSSNKVDYPRLRSMAANSE